MRGQPPLRVRSNGWCAGGRVAFDVAVRIGFVCVTADFTTSAPPPSLSTPHVDWKYVEMALPTLTRLFINAFPGDEVGSSLLFGLGSQHAGKMSHMRSMILTAPPSPRPFLCS